MTHILHLSLFILSLQLFPLTGEPFLPIVVNTWPFINATKSAWAALQSGASAEEALVKGCSTCEAEQCDGSVGFGNHPDETGETTLDAMIMDGTTLAVGAVGDLRRVKNAIGVAQAVMRYSDHTLLVGQSATDFAVEMGFKQESLSTKSSMSQYKQWRVNNCQPNYRQHVSPDPRTSCGPYTPALGEKPSQWHYQRKHHQVDGTNHDTIGMVVIDGKHRVWAGTSTNGMNHKVAGRVGDSPIMGAGAYADSGVGGAAATGDGDVMMRFLPSFRAVLEMEYGVTPEEAARRAIAPIIRHYPKFSGALVAVNKTGHHGASCHGFGKFGYSVASPMLDKVSVIYVDCT